ncbi:hypothetical protein [Williamsia sp. DF01-3]|uniref:hypothetical protein n=1 Tax=Williamsia sp. DF01-3 TaxID=2934157 RepID=UPI001FF5514C|nr:hypothetical protein [Williamsia sp. DF01-3]MCK0517846.1 hypothetical protein [Williamsia sp. DF01-3]
MAIDEVTYYRAKCDVCKTVQDEYWGDFSALGGQQEVREWVSEDDHWAENSDGQFLCPECRGCEVCKAYPSYDDGFGHLVCEDHEDHFAPAPAAPSIVKLTPVR